jgi:formylglycine-generating enzyme required for sulfatase activity
LGTTEITVDQYRRVIGSPAPGATAGARGDLAAGMLDWFDAARFCRRLSELEGLSEEQMCYPPVDQIVEGMVLEPDYLSRRGYRIPTEAEWVYGCRAGSAEEHHFGHGQSLLPLFAWTVQNADGAAHPVGLLMPNRLGLFDVLGNLYEWCEGFAAPPPPGRPAIDRESRAPIRGKGWQHGGAYDSRLSFVRFSYRNAHPRNERTPPVGFRVAKTCQ